MLSAEDLTVKKMMKPAIMTSLNKYVKNLKPTFVPQGKTRVPRVLILSASVGGGHTSAANAIEAALKQMSPNAIIKNADVLQFSNAAFRYIYRDGYWGVVHHAPHMLGFVYDMLDRRDHPYNVFGDRIKLLAGRFNLWPLIKLVKSEQWDIIVSTHFLPVEIVAWLKREKKLGIPQFAVITDFIPHRIWVNQPCERYFTAAPESADRLKHLGVPQNSVVVTGIPIHPRFATPRSQQHCLEELGLAADADRPTILQLAGDTGVGPIEKIYKAILSVPEPIQIALVTGRNNKAKETAEKIQAPGRHRVKIMGYTNNIHELMTASDIAVTKPGGLTSSEALACGLPVIIVEPVPGQESHNSDFLLEKGAAVKASCIDAVTEKISNLLREPEQLARMKENALLNAKPHAASKIARHILETIYNAILNK